MELALFDFVGAVTDGETTPLFMPSSMQPRHLARGRRCS